MGEKSHLNSRLDLLRRQHKGRRRPCAVPRGGTQENLINGILSATKLGTANVAANGTMA